MQIAPILFHGSEIIGYHAFDVLEKAHLSACKRFLGVRLNTTNKIIYDLW